MLTLSATRGTPACLLRCYMLQATRPGTAAPQHLAAAAAAGTAAPSTPSCTQRQQRLRHTQAAGAGAHALPPPVLICGAGPSGLTLALLLSQYGESVGVCVAGGTDHILV